MLNAPTLTSTLRPISSDQEEQPKWRLYLLRGLYFLNFISLFFDNWSTIFFPEEQMDTLSGVAISFWASFSLLMLIGIRFPTKMLPLLLLQLLYKSAWIIGTYLPAYSSEQVDDSLQSFFWVCIAGIVLNLIVIPWLFVYRNYLRSFFKFK